MTKTIIIGPDTDNHNKKPIEFKMKLMVCGKWSTAYRHDQPQGYKYVELIAPQYTHRSNGGDLMFAYNDPKIRTNGVVFLGDWNDGVV